MASSKTLLLLLCALFALTLILSSEVSFSDAAKQETNSETDGVEEGKYGGGGYGGDPGGSYGGGGRGGYGGGGRGGGGYGGGGRGGGGYGGGGHGGGGCRYGCCYRGYRGCSRCCADANEAKNAVPEVETKN